MRERFCPKDGKELETNPDVMVDKVAFHPSEQGFYQRLTRPDLADFIEECEDHLTSNWQPCAIPTRK